MNPRQREAIDRYLDNLDSLLITLSQRRLDESQRDRQARMLQTAERGLLLDFGREARERVRAAGAGLHSIRCSNAPCSCSPIAVAL